MEYNHREIEKKWQQFWENNQTYKTDIDHNKPKYYVLDMFPYPSGAGLHVGHPLGYIASDIISRYKRLKGFNVLHPMGFDSFGLPAEQYAIQTGQHPAITTEQNISTFISQMKNIGFSYDWSREVRTSDPNYYKWTQWIFMQLFNHYYDKDADKALPITHLVAQFEKGGSAAVNAVCDEETPEFTAENWNAMSEKEQQILLLKYRFTFPEESYVNWCPGLGTVLSNDEVKDGVSERGGFPVERKLMKQWAMRITAYADRLLTGLDTIDWPEPLKEQQRNWIGKSVGASVKFKVASKNNDALNIEVFTTRVDTIYGVSFMVLAPEHEWALELTTPEQKEAVETYIKWAASRSEVDRMAEKKVTGVFTGSYCINPLSEEKVPIFLADYVLAGYGTGAVMGVPSGDQRDWNFATNFGLPIVPILDSQKDIDQQADNTKEGTYINSGIINGMTYKEATDTLIGWLEERKLGKGKVQYRLRNAVFSRQRYWGEPVPVYFKDHVPYLIDESELPLELPKIDKYLPTETGEPPLGRAEGWKYKNEYEYELSTMPGWAGSSWYWYRYMDPQNNDAFASKEAIDYWQRVDFYLGGSEHATGHLLYSRFWNKFLKDLGLVPHEEFAAKLLNQGMIQGRSNFVYRLRTEISSTELAGSKNEDKELLPSKDIPQIFISKSIVDLVEKGPIDPNYHDTIFKIDTYLNQLTKKIAQKHPDKVGEIVCSYSPSFAFITKLHVDVNIVDNDVLDVAAFKNWREDFTNAEFILEDGKYVCGWEVEKMSKSKFNVVNPDNIVEKYGADTLRMYEMFLGPLTDAKPWNMNGISGTFNFLRKFWRLFFEDQSGKQKWTDAEPTAEELKVLHRTIKRVEEDIERLSFNTVVSTFMIAVNDLSDLKCHKKAILKEMLILLAPYAPHITEELWVALGNEAGTISSASFPVFNPKYLEESAFEYPIQINGKVRANIPFPVDMSKEDIEQGVLANETVQKWLEGKAPKKVVVVPKRIVNVVL
ncbi:leucine--tRNA ligase [Runella aurantiaca]|uniref:Leucine--tRNA ligase n=1 Tax=Runella aurantiaca TaxID=2282308 RepID=A0A369IFV0_9BACT|nr:class I tRNA ligase family protein [Runella aurantiaca]RDB05516.1 leucine--tRNA ligase [Runella aurantiaca]